MTDLRKLADEIYTREGWSIEATRVCPYSPYTQQRAFVMQFLREALKASQKDAYDATGNWTTPPSNFMKTEFRALLFMPTFKKKYEDFKERTQTWYESRRAEKRSATYSAQQ